jgi:hypothetical protein
MAGGAVGAILNPLGNLGRNDNPFAALSPFVGISRMFQEGFNEAFGFNKKREKEYQDRKISEEEAARMDLREKEIKRMGLLDEMASLAALSRGTGGGGSRTKTLYAAEEETKGDLLGL